MAVLAPLTRFVDATVTVPETSAGTWQDTGCSTLPLDDGISYFVIYSACSGFDGGSQDQAWCSLRIRHGATIIGQAESTSIGGVMIMDEPASRSFRLRGFTVVTGDGTSNLAFEAQNVVDASPGGYDQHVNAQGIIAIPLDQLNDEDSPNQTDYFADVANSAVVVAEGPFSDWTTAKTATFDIPESGDYLVFMSIEAKPKDTQESADTFDRLDWRVRSRFMVDGAARVDDFYEEGRRRGGSDLENSQVEWHNFSFVEVINFAPGEHEFRIDVDAVEYAVSPDTPYSQFRRPRIVVFNTRSFRNVDNNTSTTADENNESAAFGSDLENTTLGAVSTDAPPTDEWVVVIGASTVQGGVVDVFPTGGLQELFDDTNTVRHMYNQGSPTPQQNLNNDRFAQYLLCYAYEESMGANRDWRIRFGVAGNPTGDAQAIHGAIRNGSVASPSKTSLVFWNLTTIVTPPPPPATEEEEKFVTSVRQETSVLLDYLPSGRAFAAKNCEGTVTRSFLEGLAVELARMQEQTLKLKNDVLPDETDCFLDEWEAALGIPDGCFPGPTAPDEFRRRDIVVKLASLGVQTAADFVELAAFLGVLIEVHGGNSTNPGVVALGLTPAKTAKHTIVVNFDEATPGLFPYTFDLAIQSPDGAFLFGSEELFIIECLFNKLKPANCDIVFTSF